GGSVAQRRPVLYQNVNGKRRYIPGKYVLLTKPGATSVNRKRKAGRGEASPPHPLTLSPSHLVTLSPCQVGFQVGTYDKTRPLVIDPVMVYSTYLGARIDNCTGIAVDGNGSAIVTGYTWSLGFPTKNPAQPANAGDRDAFVTKFAPNG